MHDAAVISYIIFTIFAPQKDIDTHATRMATTYRSCICRQGAA